MKNKTLLGHLLAFITIFIWGTTFVSTKILLRDLSPIEILFYRFIIAYAILWVIYPRFHKIKSAGEELLFLSLGLSGVTMYFLVENMALDYTYASNVGLIVSMSPISTAIAAHLFTRDEKFRPNLVWGFLMAISGIFLVVFNGRFVLKLNMAGDLLALLSALTWTVYSVLLKKVDHSHSPLLVVRKTFFYGLLAITPMLFVFKADLKTAGALSLTVALNVLFLGFAASALCFVMWNTTVRFIGTVKANNYIYLVPLITMVTSMLVLHEKVNWLMCLGGALILSGVYVAEKGFRLPFSNRHRSDALNGSAGR